MPLLGNGSEREKKVTGVEGKKRERLWCFISFLAAALRNFISICGRKKEERKTFLRTSLSERKVRDLAKKYIFKEVFFSQKDRPLLGNTFTISFFVLFFLGTYFW